MLASDKTVERRRAVAGGQIELVGFPRSFAEESWVVDRPIAVARYLKASATPFRYIPVDDGTPQVGGAIYDATGRLVAESERPAGRGRQSQNPATLDRRPAGPMLAGDYVYVGFAIQSYGHFLVETLSRLWWVERLEDLAETSLLLHGWKAREGRQKERSRLPLIGPLLARFGFGPPPVGALNFLSAPWVQGFFDILGVPPGRVAFVPPTGAVVEALRVPARVVTVNGNGHPALPRIYRLIAEKVAGDVRPTARRIYFSRSRLKARRAEGEGRRRAANEPALEKLLVRNGFEIVHPQELSVVEQIRLVRSAAVIAGCDGSALHNVVFARPGTRVLAFDSRVVENQLAIEQSCGLVSRHLWMGGRMPYGKPPPDWQVDLERVRRNLDFAAGG